MKFVIYGAFAEGFVKKATVEVSPRTFCENIINVFAIYGNAHINIDEDFPILMPLSDGTFASGYEDTQGVAYFYFAEGYVPEDILIREAWLIHDFSLLFFNFFMEVYHEKRKIIYSIL